jgi:Tol biopolymer transport system component
MVKRIVVSVWALLFLFVVGSFAQVIDIGGRIVFVSDRSGSWNLWIHDLVTNVTTPLTNFPGDLGITYVDYSKWSLDGKKIAFTAGTSNPGDHEVYLINDDGTGLRQVTNRPGSAYVSMCSWDPIDPDIIYYIDVYGDYYIHKFNLATNTDTPIPNSSGLGNHYFDVTTDGSEILFCREPSNYNTSAMYVGYQNMTGNSERIIVPSDGNARHGIRINRIDNWIAYLMANGSGAPLNIFKIDKEGLNNTQLTFGSGIERNEFPVWTRGRNDDYIVFDSNRYGNYEIVLMKADGNSYPEGMINLTNNSASDNYPDWTPINGNNVQMKLLNSMGNGIMGGIAQYYEGSWRDFGVTDSSGTVGKHLNPGTYTFRMIFENANIDKTQTVGPGSEVVFQTTKVEIDLKNSSGNLMDTGSTKFYANGWRDFGTTSGGRVYKELLPRSYTFRMNYENANADKTQDVGQNNIVQFQTANVTVQLNNSIGNPLDPGTVKFYSGAWHDFGTTSGGQVSKELLPVNYTFRMNYENANMDKAQNIALYPIVTFQTKNVTVQLNSSTGVPLDTGAVKFYAGSWREFGNTSNGQASKELLPLSYSFRMIFKNATNDKVQNVGIDPLVVYQTGNVVSDSNACTAFYSGNWQTFSPGIELLPIQYTFRFNDSTPDTKFSISAGAANHIH